MSFFDVSCDMEPNFFFVAEKNLDLGKFLEKKIIHIFFPNLNFLVSNFGDADLNGTNLSSMKIP